VVAVGVALAARRSLGGATGDTLGAGAKLVELAVYGALIACW
jgi:cobalamin synthase